MKVDLTIFSKLAPEAVKAATRLADIIDFGEKPQTNELAIIDETLQEATRLGEFVWRQTGTDVPNPDDFRVLDSVNTHIPDNAEEVRNHYVDWLYYFERTLAAFNTNQESAASMRLWLKSQQPVRMLHEKQIQFTRQHERKFNPPPANPFAGLGPKNLQDQIDKLDARVTDLENSLRSSLDHVTEAE